MTAFSVEAARELPGSDGLRARRAQAAEAFAAASLPSTDEEVWRYSRIGEFDLDGWRPATGHGRAAKAGIPAPVETALAAVPHRAATVVIVDGEVALLEIEDDAVEIAVGADVDADSLGAVLDEQPTDVFATLNTAFASAPVVIDVRPSATVGRPVAVVHWSAGTGLATFPRVVVRAGENSAVDVIEYAVSADGGALLTVPVVELDAGRAARLGYVSAQNLGRTTWQLGSLVARVDADATLMIAGAAFGGDYARQRIDCRLVGRGATGNLVAVYFGEGDQTHDFRTFQDHAAPDTTSNLLFKGAVDDRSRSVYTGLIRVRKNARGTNAFQTNRNIKLSEDAWAESVPNLEIENNDVRCSHASAVGPVDEEQRFYLESRGVPTPIAERLVVTGFFDEVLDQLPVAGAAGALRSLVAAKLDRRTGGGDAS